MKKIIIIVISILIIVSIIFLTINTTNYIDTINKVNEIKEKLNKLDLESNNTLNNYQDKELEYENLKKSKENIIKEFNEWEKRLNEIKQNL